MKSIIMLILVILLATPFTYAEAIKVNLKDISKRKNFKESLPRENFTLQDEQTFGSYTVRIYIDKNIGGEGLLQILKNGKIIYSVKGWSFHIGSFNEVKNQSLIKMGRDITGDGESNLVVGHWSGGAHCCLDYYVFSIGKEFKLLDKIEAEHSGASASFEDVDKDGVPEFLGNDWTFAYWNECFAGSPAPSIVLKYKDGKYRLALDLMKKPLLSKEEENKVMQEIQNRSKQLQQNTAEELKKPYAGMDLDAGTDTGYFAWIKGNVVLSSLVWGYMLDLIYTGHPKEAWQFLDKVWPAGKSGKERFIADFKEQFSHSPYWNSIKSSLGKNN